MDFILFPGIIPRTIPAVKGTHVLGEKSVKMFLLSPWRPPPLLFLDKHEWALCASEWEEDHPASVHFLPQWMEPRGGPWLLLEREKLGRPFSRPRLKRPSTHVESHSRHARTLILPTSIHVDMDRIVNSVGRDWWIRHRHAFDYHQQNQKPEELEVQKGKNEL